MKVFRTISLYLYSDKWYKKKKSKLQLKILELLSSHKRLSKSDARRELKHRELKHRHHWPEISDAFNKLRNRGFIEIIAKDTRKRGKPEIYYRLTDDGIAVLISENHSPDRFWSLAIHYCYSREENEQVSLQTINDFYEFFSKKIFKFSSGRNSIIILDKVNDVCYDWLNRSGILNSDGIEEHTIIDSTRILAGHLLKVLKLLVLSPDLTIDEISFRSGIPIDALDAAIKTITMPSNGMFVSTKIPMDRDYVSKFKQQFLEHCFIVSREAEQGKRFKLSIFGIILFLTYVHQKNRSFSPSFIQTLTAYYDTIASNYGDLLPLIFGKWSLQKERLKYTAMDNFSIILDKERRYCGNFSTSVVLEGAKEYYENMKNIIQCNSYTTKEIYNAGYEAFKKILGEKQSEERQTKSKSRKVQTNPTDFTKVEPVMRKIYEFWQLIRYEEAQNYASELFQGKQTISSIEIYSMSVQDEITFVYYLNLLKKYLQMDLGFLDLAVNAKKTERLDNPHNALTKILEEDNEIGHWFSNWMKDIRQYENETFEIIKNYEETKHFAFKEERIDEEEAKSWI